MTEPRALWLPYRVDDLDAARDFYTVHLGLSQVDGWERPGERGAVLRAAGAAYVELVEAGSTSGPVPLAFELERPADVDAVWARWPARVTGPARYERGHYGFEAPAPGGATVMVWSER